MVCFTEKVNSLGLFPDLGTSPSMRRRGGGTRLAVWLIVATAMVVSACGSDDNSSGSSEASGDVTTTTVVAGAQENASGDAVSWVCKDWPNGKEAKPCAVGLKGPGGGRVFYDAGSVQPWGRFLEVAPQTWLGATAPCPGLSSNKCGTTDKKRIPKETGDLNVKLNRHQKGWYPCDYNGSAQQDPRPVEIPGGRTSDDFGAGRRNTATLLASQACTNGDASKTALGVATGYRGGGFTDWYLGSLEELRQLCAYADRDAIGGFVADVYLTSSAYNVRGMNFSYTYFQTVEFDQYKSCISQSDDKWKSGYEWFSQGGGSPPAGAVRPIRAFS